MNQTPEQVLKQYWGYSAFRHSQKEIIDAVLSKKDCLALLPTGGGKSVCFQMPALIQEGVCIVISPLIALMEDQVSQLKHKGIRAEAIHSGMSYAEIDILLDNCIYGDIKLLYVSPERLETEIFIERFRKMKVSFIAVDESHCISQWGYDFRPSYLNIKSLREENPNINVLALTASATAEVKEDITSKLELKNPSFFQRSFARPNISFAVRHTEHKDRKMLEVLQKIQGSAIVYVRSRKSTRDIATWLSKQKISATYYHAGLEHDERKKRQEAWQHNQVRVMVATNAFGMGINKEDVRTVIHLDLPENLESYYQEAGRAGRDGKHSYAVVVYHKSDIETLESKVNQSQPSVDYLKKIYQALANYFQLAEGAGLLQSFDFNLENFCLRYNFRSGNVYPALKKLEEAALIQFNESFYSPSKVHILLDKIKLYEFQVANAKFDPIIHALLRIYGAEILSSYVLISEVNIAKAFSADFKLVKTLLHQLDQLKIISYWPTSSQPKLTYLTPRLDTNRLPLDIKFLKSRKDLILGKMNAIINYVSQEVQCRQWLMLDYFDEKNFEACGICDVCLTRKKKENLSELKDYKQQINYLLKNKAMTVDELENEIKPNDRELMLEVVRELVDEGKISYDEFWVLRKK